MTVLIGGSSDGRRIESDAPHIQVARMAREGVSRDNYMLECLRVNRETFYFYRHVDLEVDGAIAKLLDGYRPAA